MNLAIKHRPTTYDEVAGNKKTITELKNRAKNNSFSKVVLFTGLAGTGKSTLQNIYIKTLLCEHLKEDLNPCNECVYCRTVDRGESTEYLKFYDGGSFGVAEADLVIDFTHKKILGKPDIKKIIVIDELQSIKSQAAIEKLLKILEKKNDNCYYVLGAMRWEKLNKAIKRRSTKYHISVTPVEIQQYLNQICEIENFKIDRKELVKILLTITSYCNGSLGEAVATLERVIYSNITTEEEMIEELKILPERVIDEIVEGLIKGDIRVMNNEISEESLSQIEWKLSLLYRALAGAKVETWQLNYIKDFLKIASIDKVNNIIQKFFELRQYPYKDKNLIEYILIGIILKNKTEEEQITRQPRQPRQPRGG